MEPAEVTWIGHATAMVSLGRSRVLIDPLGRRRCRAAGRYDAILVTHAHVDHLNRWTLSRLDKAVPLFVPRGARDVVSDLGFASVTEVEPGDQLAVAGLDIACVPTRHDNGRWRKAHKPICTGYVIAGNGTTVHHAGDVDMSTYEVFEHIGRQFRIDAALLPIGGMLPVWYYRWRRRALDRGVHIDPDTALEIAGILGAGALVPVHWGTVNLRLGPPGAPGRRLRQAAAAAGVPHLVRILDHGQSLPLQTPISPTPGDHPAAAHPR